MPKSQKVIDSIVKERNAVYYELGVIYKEKLKEYDLASTRLEQLLVYQPEEKLILPTKYNLYKIYEITNPAKAEAIKTGDYKSISEFSLCTNYYQSKFKVKVLAQGLQKGSMIIYIDCSSKNILHLFCSRLMV